jgi:hypothetical protein
MTLEGANKAMSRRGSKVKQEVSVLERLQNIRAMLIEIRETLGDNSPVEYEAPINAVAELISDVEDEAKREVVAVATEVTTDEPAKVEEEATPEQPRRRCRPPKSPQPEVEEPQQPAVTRRRKSKRDDDNKELFPFYEQSLF